MVSRFVNTYFNRGYSCIDLIFLEQESKRGIIIQTTFSRNPVDNSPNIKDNAATNKANDLNTAAAWVLSSNITDVPERIREKTEELRNSLNSGDIENVEFWYVHNAKDGEDVKRHLSLVETTAKQAIQTAFSSKRINVFSREIGINTILKWYQDSSTPILIGDILSIDVKEGYAIGSTKWNAYVTAVPAKWLYEIGKRYGDNLFSANIRGYMGEGIKDKSINSGIKSTSMQEYPLLK